MVLLIDCGSSKTPDIALCLEKAGTPCKTVHQELLPDLDLNPFSGLVISGAPILLTEVDPAPYLNRFSFLKSYQKPVLGICFGHQVMGMLHGAEMSRCPEDRDWQSIDCISPNPLWEGISNPVQMREDHCEVIDLPTGFRHLARSEVSENEAMQHVQNPWFGVQFHPEVSGPAGEKLIANFCRFLI